MPPRKSVAVAAESKAPRKDAYAERTTVIASEPPSDPEVPSTDAHLGLLIEHLTFNPRAFIDALVYVANEALYKLGEDFEPKVLRLIQQQKQDKDLAERAAEKGTHSITTLLENALDHVFDTLELYSLQSVFGLTQRQASHIVLPHHAGLDLRDRDQLSQDDASGSSSDQSQRLSQRQRDLTRKVNAARSASYALGLALQASQRRLTRTRSIHARLLALLGEPQQVGGEDNIAEALNRLSHSVSQIASHRAPLLEAVERLRATDPLGQALIHSTSTLVKDEEGELGKKAAHQDPDQPWSSGREGYLRWQTERLLSSNRRLSGLSGSTGEEQADVTFNADASRLAVNTAARKRKSEGLNSGGNATKRLAARPSVALHSTQGGMEGQEVGKTTEMEVSQWRLR